MFAKIKSFIPIFLLTCAHGAVDSYLGLLQILAPAVAIYLNVPLGDVVMLVGVTALLNNLTQPFAGYIMGRRNLAWTLWFSIALSSLPVFMGYASGLWTLAILAVLGGFGTGLYHPEAVLSAHDVTGDRAYLGIPLFMAGGAAIYALATPLSIKVTETYGLRALAWFAVPGLVLTLIFYFKHRKLRTTHPSVVIRPRSKRITKIHAGNIAFWPLLTVAIFFCVASGLFLSVFSSHYELLYGPSARHWAGWVLMIMGVGASLSSFMWSALAKRWGFYRLAIVTQLIAFPLFFLMAHPSTPAMGFLYAIPLSIVTPAAIHPVGVTLSRNAAGSTQGMRTSLMVGGTYAVASVAIMLAGVALRRGVDSGYVVVVIAFCSLAALLLSAWQLWVTRRDGATGDRMV